MTLRPASPESVMDRALQAEADVSRLQARIGELLRERAHNRLSYVSMREALTKKRGGDTTSGMALAEEAAQMIRKPAELKPLAQMPPSLAVRRLRDIERQATARGEATVDAILADIASEDPAAARRIVEVMAEQEQAMTGEVGPLEAKRVERWGGQDSPAP